MQNSTMPSQKLEENRELHFPEGATKKEIPKAEMANSKTTVELVSDQEPDAYYFRSLEQKGVKLNEPQLQATRHLDGPALVLAGAGSGKTRVLSSRAGYLLSIHNVNPKQILLLTFTKKAADEMKERIGLLPGLSPRSVREITTGTYHSIFLKLLKGRGDSRSILSNEKRKHIYLKNIMREMNVKDDYEPESLLAILSHYKNNMTPVEGLPTETPVEKEVKKILTKYEKIKHQEGYMDFDDILLDAYHLLKQDQHVLDMLQKRYSFVLCDEWQDTNPVQYELIKMIAAPQNNLFVVGDDDQTIYEFNGADSSIILNFNKQYPGTKTYKLDINYRSNTKIVGLANNVISINKQRYEKTLQASKENEASPSFLRPKDPNEEAEKVVQQIVNEVSEGKRSYREFAILYRANSNSRAIFDQFVLQGIPFVTYGDTNTFYEQSIVKPVIDHLRLALDAKNMDAVYGMLPTLYLNREKTSDFIWNKESRDPKKHLLSHALDLTHLKEFQKKQIKERIQLLDKIRTMKPLEAVREIRSFYDKYIDANEKKNLTMHKEMVKDTLSEIESSASRYKTIDEFLAFVDEIIEKNKDMVALRKNPEADVVKVMTIHKSKGLEFPVVFLIGASENVLPHRSALDANERKDMVIDSKKKIAAAIEGERRLAYVAITRAEEELVISSPCTFREKQVPISRFIMDVFSPEQRNIKYAKKNKNQGQSSGEKVSILVWACTSNDCIAWKRIETYKDTLVKSVDCPLCGGTMVQGNREVEK
ncbi:UvrD-helicase domain-containing protein [Pontibacillus marinus]|uniref:DNA 3'-5' helicase n=1 Tax=Pontibacillus marinus BH030004 = DSM 16465 TaxID=1385511 RepID=A0A0A5GF01_9BACI|nr:UvrD-helicase domain-containing protein [Pontibacillus marinus]KGX91801.1 ATP-dependent DNA helicase UvrD [Pontibacillus marinus BH030004 = DSM 16465]